MALVFFSRALLPGHIYTDTYNLFPVAARLHTQPSSRLQSQLEASTAFPALSSLPTASVFSSLVGSSTCFIMFDFVISVRDC